MSLASYILNGLGASTFAAFPTPTPTASAIVANPTACGDIVRANLQLNRTVFNATTVYQCLTSVPFNGAISSRFIRYYNDTLQFHSTLGYLKQPPAEYQQPATDLIAGLGRIQQAINDNLFPNQYSFEATLQQLIYSAHDAHVQLVSGALAAFKFAAPFEIVSVSKDGIELPKVYIFSDLLENETEGPFDDWAPSAVTHFNGQPVLDYLTAHAAANSVGNLEPHTDWNALMRSPAIDVQGFWEIFGGSTTFFPQATIDVKFENGTSTGPLNWLAFYNSPGDPGPLETGGDFYNFFVLGLYPAAYYEQFDLTGSDDTTNGTEPTATEEPVEEATPPPAPPQPTSWGNIGYPARADVIQPDLGTTGAGVITGYFFNDTKLGVLSLPSFDEAGEAIGNFSNTIHEFILRSKAAGMKKILVDVQENSGGNSFLAIDAFKQFFPDNDPFLGSRRRRHPMAGALGETITQVFDSLPTDDDWYNDLAADEWVITPRLNAATGRNFSSWAEYYRSAAQYNGDSYTATERYNLSSFIFNIEASGGIVVFGTAENPATYKQPYAAEDIIILSDGLCSSACAIFMELMHHEAGVRTVVAGGRPEVGPMQAPAQSRGARVYSSDILDPDISFALSQNVSAASILPNRTINQDVWISYASLNLRDQIRKGETTPLQFKYEAATCRIFFTPKNFYNYTVLWKDAAAAIWTTPKLCVQGSTGYSVTGNATASRTPPRASPLPDIGANPTGIPRLPQSQARLPPDFDGGSTIEADSGTFASLVGKPCLKGNVCPGQLECEKVSQCNAGIKTPTFLCVPACSSTQSNCPNGFGTCQLKQQVDTYNSRGFLQGFCPPLVPRTCPTAATERRVSPGPPPGIGGF